MTFEQEVEVFLNLSSKHLGTEHTARVEEALSLAIACHEGQIRKSDGSPYVTHCIHVAKYCLIWGLHDVTAVCGALLHDAIEDAPPAMEAEKKIRAFDADVVVLVRALSKIRSVATGDGDMPATYRRILAAASKDLRVLLIKTFDVMDNSKTYHVHKKEKARVKASIGLIYVGITRRLGILALAEALIKRIIPHLMPVQYGKASNNLQDLHKQAQGSMKKLTQSLNELIDQESLLEVICEERTLADYFLLGEKPGIGVLQRIGWPVTRMVLVVPDTAAAWNLLGRLHHTYDPMPRHIRDYLNAPRINGFKALTTRILWQGYPVNIRIVRQDDISSNQLGILAQWGVSGPDVGGYMRLLGTLGDSDLRMSEVHAHVLPDTMDVYSPRGDRFTFPVGSVVVDFAYLLHTELGEHCTGARINGVQFPPEHPLTDGDVVDVTTSRQATPQRAWLEVVKTARACTLIKNALKNNRIPVKGINRNSNGDFVVTSLTGPDLKWSTCCMPVPDQNIVGRLSDDGRWIVHQAKCDKVTRKYFWENGLWELPESHERLRVTFAVNHSTGALLEVLKLLAEKGINGQSIQGKGRSGDGYLIQIEMDGKTPKDLGTVLNHLLNIDVVQSIQQYGWVEE